MLIVLILIFINASGFLLKYFELDRFIIILGFRFHICLVFPFVLLLIKKEYRFIVDMLKINPFRNLAAFFVAIVFPVILVSAGYFLKIFNLTDPDYFYEFGLSSVIDFPVYLLWNLPQFAMLVILLKYVTRNIRFSMPVIFIITLLLFSYEFIPVGKEKFTLIPVVQFASIVMVASVINGYIKNIFMCVLLVFSLIWTGVLIFGSSYSPLIKIIFARNYDSWEGFLKVSKQVPDYGFLYYAGASLIFFLFYLIVNSLRSKNIR